MTTINTIIETFEDLEYNAVRDGRGGIEGCDGSSQLESLSLSSSSTGAAGRVEAKLVDTFFDCCDEVEAWCCGGCC